MKKYTFIAILGLTAVSCQKIADGGNRNWVIKEETTQRYSDPGAPKGTFVPKADTTMVSQTAVAGTPTQQDTVKQQTHVITPEKTTNATTGTGEK